MIFRCWSARVDFDDALTYDAVCASDAAIWFAESEHRRYYTAEDFHRTTLKACGIVTP